MSCIRGYDIKTAILQVKQAHSYFFEYMQQMTDSGFTIDDAKMSVFIYDQVLLKANPLFSLPECKDPETRDPETKDLDELPHIFALLPIVTDTTVSVEKLQELWLVSAPTQECTILTNHAESEISSSTISNDHVA